MSRASLTGAPTRGCWSSPDGFDIPFDALLAWSSVATFANLPATSAPIGLSVEGLPIAVQVIGPHLGDLTTIAFAGIVAREVPAPLVAWDPRGSGRDAAESAAPPSGGETPVDVSRAADALRRPPRESEDQAARKRR
ncbi:MAG: amidase family protein [Microbacterium sp.]